MPIYTIHEVNLDIDDEEINYIAYKLSDLKENTLNYIAKSEFKSIYDYHLNKLRLNFRDSIKELETYFPKTYLYLTSQDIKYGLLVQEWEDFNEQNLATLSFFELNERIYFLNYFDQNGIYYDQLPNYLKYGWLNIFGGVVLSWFADVENGKMLIASPNSWVSIDYFLEQNVLESKQIILQSLTQKIPYAYINIHINNIEQQKKYQIEGFSNLAVMLDTREPDKYPEEYDLLLMCHQYDHRVFWVKNGDFINGLYEIANPQAMLDEYFLHVFTQKDQEYTRFDFSQWSKIIK